MHGDPSSSAGAPPETSGDPLARRLADVVVGLHDDPTHQGVLDRTAAAAALLVPGAQHAGICLVRSRRRVAPASSTGEPVLQLDALQAETGQGPCWDAALHQQSTRVADLASEAARWPDLAQRASELGPLSVLCLQLRAGATVVGALKLVSATPGAFGPEAEQVALLLAAHASKAIADAHKLENLQLGLAHRDVIGQAKGILMERHRITADQAFALLARASQHANRKLHEVAADLAATGELPRV